MGISLTNSDFYYCFGLFRLAVIAQQIYYRFFHGQTKDERFKLMIVAVHVLEETARKVIEDSKGVLSRERKTSAWIAECSWQRKENVWTSSLSMGKRR